MLHLAEMAVAMGAGMLLVVPVLQFAVDVLFGGRSVEVEALVMATGMTLGMSVWMIHRGHRGRLVGEMAAAMYVPFLAGLVPYWAGAASGGTALLAGHLLMVPGMVLAMLARRGEYAHPVHGEPAAGGIVRAVSHRWPSLLALGLTFDSWVSPGLMPPWVLVVLGVEYLVIGLVRRQFRDRRLLAGHVAGAAAYAALAGLAALAGGTAGVVLVAAGWLLHAVWDGLLYRANRVTWRWYAEACAVVDLVIGLTTLLLLWP